MIKIGCFAIPLSLLALLLVLLSFVGVNPVVPKQTLTGLPVTTSFPTIAFDRALAIYIGLTTLAGFALFLFSAGKIWVAVGVFHNAAEFVMLVLLGSGGRIKCSAFWPIVGFYISFISITCILFKFPYDALWFKGQGLCFDWALIIEFTRIYLTTKHELRHDSFHPKIYHPNQLLLLIIGSVFHVLGNIVFTVLTNSFYGYCAAFPAYTYYIYLDFYVPSIYPQKRIYLPETPSWKVAVISIFSIALSLLTIRLGV
ncbi:13805_t:CDS:2 [Dentiscutata erythropus]|uniref:13805_t:CDS:1 n=1 Tax=Dentiscutata erythropus TaxID=1348616 RepID=A0A9N9BTN8_9GLOM|nr:13805_t:CDS:2 [Dentiscutata erythropus]